MRFGSRSVAPALMERVPSSLLLPSALGNHP
jgi:hypothetical protein